MNERKPGYANARDVLPPELVQEIRLHFKGGLLWIPSDRDYFGKRKTLVLELRDQGLGTTDIARLANLTPRRVRQIVMEANRNYEGTGNEEGIDSEAKIAFPAHLRVVPTTSRG